jgi:hypothetical protein
MAAFFTSLLPQFGASFAVLALLGLVFCAMTFFWLACCVFPVTQDEHEDDAQDEHVEPDIPGAGSAVRAHGGAVVLTVTP